MNPPSPQTTSRFLLLSNHGHALVAIAEDPDTRIRDIALRVGITERAAQTIVNALAHAGYIKRTRVGRRNTYTLDHQKPLRHPTLAQSNVGSLLSALLPSKGQATDAALPGRRERPTTGSSDR